MTREDKIKKALQEALTIESLMIIDDSEKHKGHAGAQTGMSHYSIEIISPDFEGCNTVKRHRMVYDAIGSLMQTDIHALCIKALTPTDIK